MSRHDFSFRSQQTFMRCRGAGGDPARFGVAGVTWDGSVTNRPGARFGPSAIRQASSMLCDATHPLFGVSPQAHTEDHGDLPLPNTSLSDMRAALEPAAEALLRRQHMVWLGGDHAITLSLLRAAHRVMGRPLALLHFDAHCDTWTDHFGEPSGHGTWVHEAISEGLVDPRATVQVGIRSAAEAAARDYVAARGGLVLEARRLRGLDGAALAPMVETIAERLRGNPVYLSLDIDCLDPAFAPGTGTPEPGGLTSTQLLTLVEDLCCGPLDFVGMDCVEVAPAYDHAELTSNAAATVVWTYLSARMAAGART